jgi:hypothetical protein
MKKFPILIILLLAISFLSFSVFASPAYINSCGTLEFNGDYILNQSISSTGSCLSVTASNVSINLSGYRITITSTNSGAHPISFINTSLSNTYYVFDGELKNSGTVATNFAIACVGGTLLINNISVVAPTAVNGFVFYFINTNVTIVNSKAIAGTNGFFSIANSGGLKYSLFINNSLFNSSGPFLTATTNFTILKMFNSIVNSTDLLTNNLGLSTNNESQIVNVLFSSVNTASFNGYLGLLNNAERGNYYGNAGFGYSDLCNDDYPTPTHDGICDLQYNLSNAVDYFPLSAEGFMMMVIPVDTSFAWSSSSYLSSLPPTYAWDRNSCPVPSNLNYLFCDNFQYDEYINSNGWTDTYNQTSTYYVGSKKLMLGNSTYYVSALTYGAFFPIDVSVSSLVSPTGTYVQNTEYNTNIAIAEFSFDFITLNNSASFFFGISAVNPAELGEQNLSIDYYNGMDGQIFDYGRIYYSGSTNRLAFWNYSAGSTTDLDNMIQFSGYGKHISVKAYLYPERSWSWDTGADCKIYYTITADGNTTTSPIYEAGFNKNTLAGQTYIDIGCDAFRSIYFYSNGAPVYIDNVFVRKYKDAQSLNMKIWDCSEMNVPVQQNKGYVNEYPIIADVLLNGVVYTSDSQGLIDIPNIPEGTYRIKVTYDNLDNFIILNSTSNNSFRQNICWFNSINQSANEIGINGAVDNFGKNWSKNVKLLVALGSVVVVLVGLFFLISGIPAIVPVVAAMIPFAYFISVGFVPFWVAILLFVVFIAAILLALKGGQ